MFAFLNGDSQLLGNHGSVFIMDSIGWALFHFLWQGALIAALVGLLLSLMQRCSANIRYWVACAGLLAMAVCPVATLVWMNAQPELETSSLESMAMAELESNLDSRGVSTNSIFALTQNETAAKATARNAGPSKSPRSNPDRIVGSAANEAAKAESATTQSNPEDNSNEASGILSVLQSRVAPCLPWLVTVWIAGVCWLSLRMIWSWGNVQRIKSSGKNLTDEPIVNLFQSMAERIGLSGKARLLQSSQVVVPTVIGWLKPVVLMPASAMTGLNSDQLSAILAHELAHIRRADYLVNLAQSFIETVLFYHPCVWWLSARIRVERENCCDDLATSVSGDARSYAEALLRLEQTKPTNADTPPALAMGADGGSLVERVARLLGKNQRRNRSPYWLVGVVSLTVAVVAIAFAVPDEIATANGLNPAEDPAEHMAELAVQEESTPGKSKETDDNATALPEEITVTVLDSEGLPLEGAHIHAGVWSKDRTFAPNQMHDTGAGGKVTLTLPKEYSILRIWASAENHVLLFTHWEEENIKSGDQPTAEYTFKMIKGSTISGVIQDEKGNPIKGAKIGIRGLATHPGNDSHVGYGHSYAEGSGSGGDTRLLTDEDGRWSINTLPPADDLKITLTVAHPDFIDDPKGELQKAQGVTTEQFRAGVAVIKMQTGTALTGKIVDEDGEAIDNGIVVWGDRPYWDAGPQETRIEADGRFEIPSLPNGTKRITVMAPGFRPETRMVEISTLMDPLDFEMVPGKQIRIRIVDGKTNEAIPNGYVGIDNWRTCEALYNHKHPNVIDSQIPLRGDALGVWTWNWAPDDQVVYQVSAVGYSPNHRVPLTASDEVHVVKLYKPLSISGRVVDAETKETIPDFGVIPVVCNDSDKQPRVNGQRRHSIERGRSGRFRITLQNDKFYRLLIEADGYKPKLTDEVFKLGDEVPRLRLELEPSAWAEGRVVDADGNPVESVRVMFATKTSIAQLNGYKLNGIVDFANSANTTKEGSYKVPQLLEPATVIAMHKHGYAEVTRRPGEELGELKLKPWVKVKGVLRDSHGNPVSGVKVSFEGIRYEFDHSYHVQDMTTATTDNQGRYELSRLPGIRGTIRPLGHMTDKLRAEHSIPVDLSSATEHVVDIGGVGVKVTGRLKLTGTELTDIDYSEAQATMLPIAEPKFGLPAMLKDCDWRKGWSEAERIRTSHQYWTGRTYLGSFHKVQLNLDQSGSFEAMIDSPGTYDIGTRLNVRAAELGGGRFSHSIGESSQRITITKEQFDSGRVDVGEIEIAAHPQLKIGDEVPDFEFRNKAGATMRLHQQRGQYVLVDFWATWCKVCNEDYEQLNELANELAEAKSTAKILSVELPGTGNFKRGKEDVRAVWSTNKLVYDDSTSAYSYEAIFKKLGIWSVPRYIIVDAEGKLVYHGHVEGAVTAMRNLR